MEVLCAFSSTHQLTTMYHLTSLQHFKRVTTLIAAGVLPFKSLLAGNEQFIYANADSHSGVHCGIVSTLHMLV